MPSQTAPVTRIDVKPGADMRATLPKQGVLRFERKAGAMVGVPAFVVEDGVLALHFADGASLRVEGV